MLITLTRRNCSHPEVLRFVDYLESAATEWAAMWWTDRHSSACALCKVPFKPGEYFMIPWNDAETRIVYDSGLDMCLECAIQTVLGDVEIPNELVA